MEIKRLRKSKTLKTDGINRLSEIAAAKTADAIRRQKLEIMKIPDAFADECENINCCGYEIMRVSRNLKCYFAAVAGSWKIGPEKTDLSEYIKYLCRKSEPFAKKADVRILCRTPEEKIITNVDNEAFSYAFYDILRNSMEHSPAKNKIKVTLQKLSKFAKITVSDKGEGMDEETFRHCAEPLFSSDNKMGLGLSLAEYFINLSGGRVKIISEKEKGTSVAVFLPLCEDEKEILAAKDGRTASAEGKFIPAEVAFSGIGKNEE